jgi:hypothetical protein
MEISKERSMPVVSDLESLLFSLAIPQLSRWHPRSAAQKKDVGSNTLSKEFLILSATIQFPQNRNNVPFPVVSSAGKFYIAIRN